MPNLLAELDKCGLSDAAIKLARGDRSGTLAEKHPARAHCRAFFPSSMEWRVPEVTDPKQRPRPLCTRQRSMPALSTWKHDRSLITRALPGQFKITSNSHIEKGEDCPKESEVSALAVPNNKDSCKKNH